MTIDPPPVTVANAPRPRSDAVRNRARLLVVARDAFTAGEGNVALDTLARRAGVGIGTLYRHFPTRQALVEAVYRSELDEVAASADEVLGGNPADVALRLWIDRYATFFATKHGMAETLQGLLSAGVVAPTETRQRIRGTLGRFLEAGEADGTLRHDVAADDVVTALVGAFLATAGAPDAAQRDRVLDLLVDGLRSRGGTTPLP
ncbi:TetR/AcrR family transcriptional regulator [Arthrobacter livingstonensis]|uniref:TetR/AcrR family transcriptional regulator n=1 Tax=Arthrobacter livingstonensis TaxID=670078 RepID=UPI0014728D23|nr:TetR/AcrR family transcriptional regulator [Arthrobacter livingstonensis]